MRSHLYDLPFLVPALAAAFAAALPSASEARHSLLERSQGGSLLWRDGDMHIHDHRAEPESILNETEIPPLPRPHAAVILHDRL